MNLKEYIVNNLEEIKSHTNTIKVYDVDYLQGVVIALDQETKVTTLLEDRPVKKFINYIVRNTEYKDGALEVAIQEPLNGIYYLFDCLDGSLGDELLTPEEVHEILHGKPGTYTERELKTIAMNYEASLYKYTYVNGERVDSKLLYDCMY